MSNFVFYFSVCFLIGVGAIAAHAYFVFMGSGGVALAIYKAPLIMLGAFSISAAWIKTS